MTSFCDFSHISSFSDNSPEIFRHFHGGHTVKLLLINRSFHTEKEYFAV